jgi:hypothetical protein
MKNSVNATITFADLIRFNIILQTDSAMTDYSHSIVAGGFEEIS